MGDLLTTTDARLYCGITGTGADAIISTLIDGAESWVASHIGCAFASATFTEYHDGGGLFIRPAVRPVASVTSVSDMFNSEDEQTQNTDYYLRGDRLYWGDDSYAPSVWPSGYARWKVVYVGGYDGATYVVPAAVKSATLMLVARMYQSQGAENANSQGVSVSWDDLANGVVESMLAPHRLNEVI